MSSLETSLHLVSQAIYQEEAQNFEEAARCYHDAIMGFKHVVTKNKNLSPKVRESILHKCVIAEDRVKKLDRYLFNKADLTSLFKSCVDFHENIPKNESLETFGNKSMDDPRFLDRLIRQGQREIERGKQFDESRNFHQAVLCYEKGVELWLSVPQENKFSENLLFKSLIIRDRIESIKNHLETGAKIKDRRDISGNLEDSFDCGFDTCTMSPEPQCSLELNESEAFLMDEIRSNLSLNPSRRESLCSGRHCLYPDKLETQQQRSGNLTETLNKVKSMQLIPLADLNTELQLSFESIAPFLDLKSHTSSSDRSSLNDIHLSEFNALERDQNLVELSSANRELNLDTSKNYLNNTTDSGSDSGIGDNSCNSVREVQSSRLRTPLNSPNSMNIDGKSSPVPSFQSAVSFTDLANLQFIQKSSDSPWPHLGKPDSPSFFNRKKENTLLNENELIVVSTEEIRNGKVILRNFLTEEEVYQKSAKTRPEYLPPRAFAYQSETDDSLISKGCFHFVGCLDTLWIL